MLHFYGTLVLSTLSLLYRVFIHKAKYFLSQILHITVKQISQPEIKFWN